MATVFTKYTHAHKILCGAGDWTTNTIKLALVTSSYSFSAAHTIWADASTYEVASGNGYTTGGATLTTSKDDGKLDAVDVTFTALTKTFRGGVLYISGTVEGLVNPLLGYILFDNTPADIVSTGLNYVVIWNASGLFAL